MPIIDMTSPTPEDEQKCEETVSNEGKENDIPVRVFTRIRPINKLEASKRSRNCVEIHTDDTVVSVDSPVEGEYDYEFDKIFDETTDQAEFYNSVASSVPSKFLKGQNCALVAYGQTSSGKSYTMTGPRTLPAKESKDENESKHDSQLGSQTGETKDCKDTSEHAEETNIGISEEGDVNDGVFQRTIKDIFSRIKSSDPNTEYSIRCSYVDLYLEKIVDLLNPASQNINVVDINGNIDENAYSVNNITTHIQGVTEICCVDEDDVMKLLRRGIAFRMLHASQMATLPSRSHSFFILHLSQKDVRTGIEKISRLLFADLAGSEMAQSTKKKTRTKIGNQHEMKAIKKSFNALNNVFKMLVDSSCQERSHISDKDRLKDPFHQSKLTHILKDVFGGNFYTTVILTVSPASFNISETMATLRFGIKCRKIKNKQKSSALYPSSFYESKIAEGRRREKDLMSFILAMASNSRLIKTEVIEGKGRGSSFDGPIWDNIETILDNRNDEETKLDPIVSERVIGIFESEATNKYSTSKDRKLQNDEDLDVRGEPRDQYIAHLRDKLKEYKSTQEATENQLACVLSQCSELQILNDELTVDKKKYIGELIDTKNEITELSQRKLEVEHNLRTSQFRENEAAVFLRQFRRFYRRLLRNKAKQGSGDVREIAQKVPGVPDLKDLIDVDTLLLESGLIEEDEIHDDTSGAGIYRPSSQALIRSSVGAKKASRLEKVMESGVEETDDEDTSLQSSSYGTSSYFPKTFNVSSTSVPSVSEMGDGGVSVLYDNQSKVESEITEISQEMKPINASKGADDLTSIGQRKPQYPSNDITPNSLNGGADAGAGASSISGTSEVKSVASWTSSAYSTGTTSLSMTQLTEKQMILDTPAGRLVSMNQRNTERELLHFTERCIELQIALNEEKANVDALTNRTGSLGKKRMAQEAISLRQALDRKTHDLQAIIWKMNELHLINKTYNEKMENREQHVSYLEETIGNLQNQNREMIIQHQESEKKLGDELSKLRFLVDAITDPLWQLGEGGLDSKKDLSSRVIIHIQGGNVQERFDATSRTEDFGNVIDEEYLSDDSVSDNESIGGNPNPLTLDSNTQTETMTDEKGTMTEMEAKDDDSAIDLLSAAAIGTATGIAVGAGTAAVLCLSSDDEATTPDIHHTAARGLPLEDEKSNTSDKVTESNVIEDALVASAIGAAFVSGSERRNKVEMKEASTQSNIVEMSLASSQTESVEITDATTQYETTHYNECGTQTDPNETGLFVTMVGSASGTLAATAAIGTAAALCSNENDAGESSKLGGPTPQSDENVNGISSSDVILASTLIGLDGVSQQPNISNEGLTNNPNHDVGKSMTSNTLGNKDKNPTRSKGDNVAGFGLELEHNRNHASSEKLFLGGRSSSFVPRRFVRKVGPSIKPGVLKEYKKKTSKPGDQNMIRKQ